MVAEYRRNMKRTNLILMDCADTDRESYRVRMITLCGVKGFLPCRLQEVDGKLLYCYDVTSKIPLRSLFENKNIGKNILEKLFRSLSEALENLGECLLPEDGILLDPEYIYTDAEQKEILYCYCPGVETTFEEEMKELGEYLLPRLDHEDTDAVIMAYSFYQQTVSGEGLSSDLFRELIGKGSMENAKDPIFLTPEEEEERQKHEKLMDSFFSDDEADADRPGAVEKGRKTHGFANFWDQFVQFFHRWKKRKFREEDYPELRADRESEFLAAEESGYYNEEKKAGKVTAGKTTT
ncbi:MAG: DUF6382 domain-containing protein, partial [Eubacterium sp.]|nr:DUF6382 domain-containing protein [Eubacterium sp.]